MKLAVSNIAWSPEQDERMYSEIHDKGFTGVEIAPTRWIEQKPYDFPERAKLISGRLSRQYGFVIPSMQSIWYGRPEALFGTSSEINTLIEYTKKAILFAENIGCKNLVFGCPGNRIRPEGMSDEGAVRFFKELGDYAYHHHTVLAMEANPVIYNTNYINMTTEAIELVKRVESPGFLLNYDFGTAVENHESLECLSGNEHLIHHIHISEPGLLPIQKRSSHSELADMLKAINYPGFISVEMRCVNELSQLIDVLSYVKETFGSCCMKG